MQFATTKRCLGRKKVNNLVLSNSSKNVRIISQMTLKLLFIFQKKDEEKKATKASLYTPGCDELVMQQFVQHTYH